MIGPANLPELSSTLLSGLIGSLFGAVVGGYYSYQGAMDATKTQIKYLYDQEKEKRKYIEKREQESMLHSLLSESKENLNLATKWQTSHSKSILSTETWSIYKGGITFLSPALQEKIIRSYAEIKRYNALAEYDKAKGAAGHGMLDQPIQQQAGVVVQNLTPLVEELRKHLKIK